MQNNYDRRKIFAVFLVLAAIQSVDLTLGSLSDVFRDFAVSPSGIALFVAITLAYGIGQYFILGMVKTKNKEHETKRAHFKMLERTVTIIQYALTAIVAAVVIQVLFVSQYQSGLLIASTTVSYSLAICLMGLLAYWLFSWLRVKRTLIVLLYGLAVTAVAINAASIMAFFDIILLDKPQTITPQSEVVFPPIEPGSTLSWINSLQSFSGVSYFLLLWGGTIMLLRHNIQRVGQVKFSILVAAPMVFFMSFYISFYQSLNSPAPAEDVMTGLVFPFLVVIFSAIAAMVLFGIAFRSAAKSIGKSYVRDYMIITSYGLILFFMSISTSIVGAGYPPFGLANVSLAGPLSFLILTGLYRSAISISEDIELRRSIKTSAKTELNLLDSIGSAEMQKEIEKRIMAMTKTNAALLTQQSGIEPSLTDEEVRDFLAHVKEELGEENKSSNAQ